MSQNYTDTNTHLIVNDMTEEQFTQLTNVDSDQLYLTEDESANQDLSNLSDAGKIVGSSLGIPSNTYDELTLGASNANYTAPSNGWFCLQRRIDNDTISIADTTSGFANAAATSGSGRLLRIIYPAFKGCNVAVYYANSSSDTSKNYFRFYYAIGSESEAS